MWIARFGFVEEVPCSGLKSNNLLVVTNATFAEKRNGNHDHVSHVTGRLEAGLSQTKGVWCVSKI